MLLVTTHPIDDIMQLATARKSKESRLAQRDFTILYTNADGLINKRQELKLLLNSLKDRPDIVAVTEILPKSPIQQLLPSEFKLEGYKVFFLGLDNKKSRGILFYVAMNLEVSVVNIPLAFEECLFLTAKSSSGQKILIGNIYRSPNSLQENDNELYELFEYCERNFKMPKVFVGDFNFRNIDWYLSLIHI